MNECHDLDILMITHARPDYTRLSLPTLLESCDDDMRVWVWQNGDDRETLDVIEEHLEHPRFYRFYHSPDNQFVLAPTNWLIRQARGAFLAVVADDCLVSDGWAQTLREAHLDVPEFGVIACWHFPLEDFDRKLAHRKIRTFHRGHQLMLNPWVQGSGVMIKRACADQQGPLLSRDKGFTPWCMRLALAGWINGWHIPLVPIEHMDDPRAPHTMLRNDDDLARQLPLSAQVRNAHTIDQWTTHLKRSARTIQRTPIDPRQYFGVRKKVRRVITRLRREELLY